MEDLKLTRLPDLPKIEFKAGKVNYSMTDLRYLNTNAFNMFIDILNYVATVANSNEVTLTLPEKMSDDEKRVIKEILLATGFTAMKKGRNGFYIGGAFLVSGIEIKNGFTMKIKLISEHAKVIYEYTQRKAKPSIYELVIAIVEATNNDIEERTRK